MFVWPVTTVACCEHNWRGYLQVQQAMTEPMELTKEQIEQSEREVRFGWPNVWRRHNLEAIFAAARAHIVEEREQYFTPEEQGRMEAAFAQADRGGLPGISAVWNREEPTTASPGDEELTRLERDLHMIASQHHSVDGRYTGNGHIIVAAIRKLRSLATECEALRDARQRSIRGLSGTVRP